MNTSIKLHIIVGTIISIWLVVFLVVIAPFDASDLSFRIRAQILPPYGIICLLGYLVIIPIQNNLFRWRMRWSLFLEGFIILIFNLLVLMGSYWYYKTSIINGLYPFVKFTFEVYYPIFFIILPIIVFARWFVTKQFSKSNKRHIILVGDNKYDVLKIDRSDLICISSADNYVEIAYLVNTALRKKLLRSTLRKIHEQHGDLLKVHRSYLINPVHFKEWTSNNSIQLTKMEVPVSKNYRQDVITLFDSPLKD